MTETEYRRKISELFKQEQAIQLVEQNLTKAKQEWRNLGFTVRSLAQKKEQMTSQLRKHIAGIQIPPR